MTLVTVTVTVTHKSVEEMSGRSRGIGQRKTMIVDYRQTHIELLILHILCINIQICIFIYIVFYLFIFIIIYLYIYLYTCFMIIVWYPPDMPKKRPSHWLSLGVLVRHDFFEAAQAGFHRAAGEAAWDRQWHRDKVMVYIWDL